MCHRKPESLQFFAQIVVIHQQDSLFLDQNISQLRHIHELLLHAFQRRELRCQLIDSRLRSRFVCLVFRCESGQRQLQLALASFVRDGLGD